MAKTRKTAANGPVNIRAEFRKLGILAKRMHRNVYTIQEQYRSIQQKLDLHTKLLNRITQIFATSVSGLNRKLG